METISGGVRDIVQRFAGPTAEVTSRANLLIDNFNGDSLDAIEISLGLVDAIETNLKVIFDKEIADRLADKWERALGSSRGIMVKIIVADVTRVLKTMGRME